MGHFEEKKIVPQKVMNNTLFSKNCKKKKEEICLQNWQKNGATWAAKFVFPLPEREKKVCF